MKRIMIVALIISESILFANAAQLARAVRVAKELRLSLSRVPKLASAPKAKAVVRPKSPEPTPKAPTQIPKIRLDDIRQTPVRVLNVPQVPKIGFNDRRRIPVHVPKVPVVIDQNLADQIRQLWASGREPAEIIGLLHITDIDFADALERFPVQPKSANGIDRAWANIENIFYDLNHEICTIDSVTRNYQITQEELQELLQDYAYDLTSRIRDMDQQARQSNDYDQNNSFQNFAEFFGLTIEQVQRLLQEYFPEEYVHEPVNTDDWLAKNQPQQMPKVIARDVLEQNPECIVCGNDDLRGNVMYQSVCCGGKTFYCPTCLQGYEASLQENQESACAACRTQPLRLRQFDIATGMYVQPVYEAKANQAAAKQVVAKLQQINQAKATERKARLARGRYVNFGYPGFDAAYNQAMIQMQFADPAMIIEEDHNRAMRRRSQNPRFEQFVQDVINERFGGNIIEVGNNLLLLPTLSVFFDRYFDGRY